MKRLWDWWTQPTMQPRYNNILVWLLIISSCVSTLTYVAAWWW